MFAAVIAAIFWLLIHAELTHESELREVKAIERATLALRDIQLRFRTIIADLQYLAQSSTVARFAAGAQGARAALEEDMLALSREKGWYDQIRFLDTVGKEQVRVDYRDGDARIVAVEGLQDKHGRYYFSDTLAQAQGATFISPLDLNVEHGRIEQPLKPMIRFGTPVFDAHGEKRGIVLLNFLAAELLRQFQNTFPPEEGDLYLLNRDGYWLSSPNADDEWGFMLAERKQRTFAQHYPDLWRKIQIEDTGTHYERDGHFVYFTMQPMRQAASPTIDPDYRWIAVAHYHAPGLNHLMRNRIWLAMPLLSLALAGFAAWMLARANAQSQRFLSHLARSRDRLEAQVAERTAQLHASHDELALLLDSTAEGIFGIDVNERCTFFNQSGLSLLGYADEHDVLGKPARALLEPAREDGSALSEDDDVISCVLLRNHSIYLDDATLRRAGGERLAVAMRSRPIRRDGKTVGAVVSFLDISAGKQAEERIRTLSQAVEQSPVSVIITDPQANIEYVNRGFEQVTGYRAEEVIGHNPRVLKSERMSPRVYRDLWSTLARGDAWTGEFQNRRKDGSLFWERAYISPVRDARGVTRHFLGIKEDISPYKEQEEKILHQAHYDFLTELPNRFLALDRLEQLTKNAARERQPVAVIFLDMDDFKKINDTLGHEIGDRLLVEAAYRLLETVRDQDTVARLGGDEFLVILGKMVKPEDASKVAEHLLEAFRTPFLLDGHELVVTVSIGVALYPADGGNVSELLRNADVAMYQSKQAGRNTYRYFASSMNRDVVRRLTVEAHLRGALQRGELELHYQPIVRLGDASIVGAEALLRWHHPELGDVSPMEFIPVAEQSGLIEVLGIFALSEACRQGAAFRRHFGDHFYVSVNASPQQFRDGSFASYVEAALAGADLPGKALVLEITEGVLLRGDSQVDAILERLHGLQVQLAMDDFGTGYSSLSYLRRYPFDILKIDRDFVRDITRDDNDRELVRAALQMGHALDLRIIAEGVEDQDQSDALLDWGCDLAQGYLFGRPARAEVLLRR